MVILSECPFTKLHVIGVEWPWQTLVSSVLINSSGLKSYS